MGGSESSTGAVIRNGDWEHRICWSESKPSLNSEDSQIPWTKRSTRIRYFTTLQPTRQKSNH